jgi:hypothetical protein
VRYGGAAASGALILRLASAFRPSFRRRLVRNATIANERWRIALKDRIGPSATDRIRRILRRTVAGEPGRTWRVTPTTNEEEHLTDSAAGRPTLLVSHRLSRQVMTAESPFEHVLADAGDSYRLARQELIPRYYDVVARSPDRADPT